MNRNEDAIADRRVRPSKKAHSSGPTALYKLAMDFALVGRDPEEAFVQLRKAAERGDSEAQHELARWYEQGYGTPCNISEAFNWYLRAAESGFTLAYWDIGGMYAEGKGVPRNGKKAESWFKRLADPRTTEDPVYMPWAQWSLGEMYSAGLAVKVDNIEAHMWLNLASAYGEQRPRHLGDLLVNAMTPKELEESKKRFDKLFIPTPTQQNHVH